MTRINHNTKTAHTRTAHNRPESSNPPPPPPPPTRRKRLNYSRSSLACGTCRNRKIRCTPAKHDPLNRCFDCVRLSKECIFSVVEKSPDPKVPSEGEIEVSYPPVPNLPEVVEPVAPTSPAQEMAQPDVAYLPVQNAYPLVQDAVPDAGVGMYFEAQETWEPLDAAHQLDPGVGTYFEAQGTWETPDAAYQPDPAQDSGETMANPDPTMPPAISFWDLVEAASLPIQVLLEDTNPGPEVPPERRWTPEELLYLFHIV